MCSRDRKARDRYLALSVRGRPGRWFTPASPLFHPPPAVVRQKDTTAQEGEPCTTEADRAGTHQSPDQENRGGGPSTPKGGLRKWPARSTGPTESATRWSARSSSWSESAPHPTAARPFRSTLCWKM